MNKNSKPEYMGMAALHVQNGKDGHGPGQWVDLSESLKNMAREQHLG
jgi:hypothetical protein